MLKRLVIAALLIAAVFGGLWVRNQLIWMRDSDARNSSIRFSPDGSAIVALVCDDRANSRRVLSWNLKSKKLLTVADDDRAALAPGGLLAADGRLSGPLLIKRPATGETLMEIRSQLGTSFFTLAPDGRSVAVAGGTGGMAVWDVEKKAPVFELPLDESVVAFRFSANGRTLAAVATKEGRTTIRLIDVPDRRVAALASHVENTEFPALVEVSADGAYAVTRTAEAKEEVVQLWTVKSGRGQTLARHSPVEEQDSGFTFSPASDALLIRRTPAIGVRIVRCADGSDESRFDFPHTLQAVEFSPDGRFVSVLADGSLSLIDRRAKRQIALTAPTVMAYGAVFSPTSTDVVALDESATATIYDTTRRQARASFQTFTLGDQISFSPDGSAVAVAAGKRVSVADAKTGAARARIRMRYQAFGAAFSPDGKYLATGAWDALRVWDASTGKLLGTRRIQSGLRSFIKDVIASFTDREELTAPAEPDMSGYSGVPPPVPTDAPYRPVPAGESQKVDFD